METIDINNLLQRHQEECAIKTILSDFESNKHILTTKKGIYVYGEPGTGKTTFVTNILKEMGYDIIKYDAGDIRNKTVIDTITKHNMSDKNIMSMYNKKVQRIAIIMDEIDGMNNGDKGGINSLIKLIRPKRTKKQRVEEITLNPIICIGNYHIDKKIKELMKVCHVVELIPPTRPQISSIISLMMPTISDAIKENVITFIQGDLRKLNTIYNIYQQKENILQTNVIQNIFLMKSYNDDTRKITKKLLNNNYTIDNHLNIMNETDRTIVGLLWHENVIDIISKMKKEESIPFYLNMLDNMCFSDYIDRITFQKQIWQFNEMSSLIKTFKNNKIFHEHFLHKKITFNPADVRFTKVLTKYSTEYNNSIFIQNLCQQLGMDRKDMFIFFLDLKNKHTDIEITALFENYDISKLDINRIFRYLEKYTTADAMETEDVVIESDQEA